jgi:hypothetical protein
MPAPDPKDLGPLAAFVGTWEGDQGLDISYHHADGEVGETPYREKVDLKPFGPVDNGEQALYGLDYRMAAFKEGEDEPFHTEVGYWLWDPKAEQIIRCVMVPRGQVVLAAGPATADATTMTVEAEWGSNTHGILSNEYVNAMARTSKHTCTMTVNGDGTWSYNECTVYEVKSKGMTVNHEDSNTLRKVG